MKSDSGTVISERHYLENRTMETAFQRDGTYYWVDNVTFSVEDTLFRVSPYPFILGSEYFVEKYNLLSERDRNGAERVIHLEGVTAAQFRVFLKFLFPVHITSTTSTFTKEEWITILKLSTSWHFHEVRSLAVQHLEGRLRDIELILFGRAGLVPRWVLQGYRGIVEKPVTYTLPDHIGDAIGHRELNRIWAVRYDCAVFACDDDFVGEALCDKFREELEELSARELRHRTKAEREAEERLNLAQNGDEPRAQECLEQRGVEDLLDFGSGTGTLTEETKAQTVASQSQQGKRGQPQLEQGTLHQRTGEAAASQSDQAQDGQTILHGESRAPEGHIEHGAALSTEKSEAKGVVNNLEGQQQEEKVEQVLQPIVNGEKQDLEKSIQAMRSQLGRTQSKAARSTLKKAIRRERERLRIIQMGS